MNTKWKVLKTTNPKFKLYLVAQTILQDTDIIKEKLTQEEAYNLRNTLNKLYNIKSWF